MESLLVIFAVPFIVLIVIPACITNSAGHAKNRDYGVWYGLLLGWLGVLAMVAMPPLPAKPVGPPRIHSLNRWTTDHPLLMSCGIIGACAVVGLLYY